MASNARIQNANERLSNPSTQIVVRAQSTPSRDLVDLHKACRQGNSLDVEFLVSQDPSLLNSESKASEDLIGPGGTALHYATLGDNPHIISFLLLKNANVDAESHRGLTPLYIACSKGLVECADVLMQHGSSLLHRNRQGVTPMAILRQQCGVPDLCTRRQMILTRSKSLRPGSSVNQSILRIADRAFNRR